jgi:hypothetical protein
LAVEAFLGWLFFQSLPLYFARCETEEKVDKSLSSSMLAFLHGRINGRDSEKAQDATEAKDIYSSLLTPSEKNEFLKNFMENGRGKQRGSFKLVGKRKQQISTNDLTSVTLKADYMTRPAHARSALSPEEEAGRMQRNRGGHFDCNHPPIHM